MKKKNTFTLRLTDEQFENLKQAAKRERRTSAAIIRNFLDDLKTEKQNNK